MNAKMFINIIFCVTMILIKEVSSVIYKYDNGINNQFIINQYQPVGQSIGYTSSIGQNMNQPIGFDNNPYRINPHQFGANFNLPICPNLNPQIGINLYHPIGFNNPLAPNFNSPIELNNNPLKINQNQIVNVFEQKSFGGLYTDNSRPNGFDRLMGTTSEQADSYQRQPRFYVAMMMPGDATHLGGVVYIKQEYASRIHCICPGYGIKCHCSTIGYQ
jgi:hypothetical protein